MTQTRPDRPRRDRRAVRRALLSLLPLLAGCSDLTPFEGVPRDPAPGLAEGGPRIAICYNAMFSSPEAVRKAAAETCGPRTVPQLAEQDMRLMCPLMTPVRATFICAPE